MSEPTTPAGATPAAGGAMPPQTPPAASAPDPAPQPTPEPAEQPEGRLKSDGTFADGRHRKLHPRPCTAWGEQARYGDETSEEPILGQVAGIELDDATIGALVSALGGAPRPVGLDRARIDRRSASSPSTTRRAASGDAVYLERLRELREAKDSVERASGERVAPDRAIEWLRALSATWTEADVPEAKADVLHAIYDQIVVRGREIVSVRLTPSAHAHGLALALPTKVELARPTGVERADARNIRIPVERSEVAVVSESA